MVSLWWPSLLIPDPQLCYSSFQHLDSCPADRGQPRKAPGVSVLGCGFPRTRVQTSHVLHLHQLATCQILVLTQPWPSHPCLLACFILSSFLPFPRLLIPSYLAPLSSSCPFSLSCLLSPLNILHPSFGQNFKVSSLALLCFFFGWFHLVLAPESPYVWSDPRWRVRTQHSTCTGLYWAYWSISGPIFTTHCHILSIHSSVQFSVKPVVSNSFAIGCTNWNCIIQYNCCLQIVWALFFIVILNHSLD